MNGNSLLNELPVFNANRDVITQEQTTRDIVNEVLAAHKFFAKDYDSISESFVGNTPKKLFDFCKSNLPYRVESEELQTTRSPSGIIALRDSDCKHYSGFIAGVIDSLNRKGLADFNWCYRFASYNIFSRDVRHVFVVIKEKNGNEIWLDPVLDELDQRHPEPVYIKDKKPQTMALVRMSGVPQQIVTSHNVEKKSDWYAKQSYGSCGCRPIDTVSGFDVSTFISQNPVPSLLIGGALAYLIYKMI